MQTIISAESLVVERRDQQDRTPQFDAGESVVMITPPLSGDYWAYRVTLSDQQAVIGFPKFFTVGIGFAVEAADWNTNLPYTCSAAEIASHIADNKGDDRIDDATVIRAIELIQLAIVQDRG